MKEWQAASSRIVAVLPGVTIEASSPALIEKVRTTVSDREGRHNFVDQVPGTYTVKTGFIREHMYTDDDIVSNGDVGVRV